MVRIIRWILLAARALTPWLVRVGVFTAWTMVTAVASIWVGVPNSVRQIANQWLNRAVAAGFPTRYDRVFYYGACVVASLMILSGWIGFSYITIWLTGLAWTVFTAILAALARFIL